MAASPDNRTTDNGAAPTPAARPRDEEFLRLYALHQRQVHAYVSAIVPNPADVDEVLQETSIVLWRKFEQFRTGEDFSRWACGVAHYEILRLRRKKKTAVLPLEDEMLEQLAADQLEMRPRLDARRDALEGCLERLRPVDRDLIERCYARDQTSRAVAEEIGRPVDAVYQSLTRIRRVLHECIDRTLAAEERS